METVREGQLVAPFCPECGCRLHYLDHMEDLYHLNHFKGEKGRDARGCLCSLVNKTWLEQRDKIYAG